MLISYDFNKRKVANIEDAINPQITYLLNGENSLEFSLSISSQSLAHLKEEYYIQVKNNEYVIKSVEGNTDTKHFKAVINVEDLVGKSIKSIDMKNTNIGDILRTAISGTGWVVTVHNVTKRRTVSLSNTNALEVIREARKKFNVDYILNAKNKTIDVYEKFGEDRGVYLSDELNITSLSVPSDTYSYATRLYPYGKDGLSIKDINGGKEYIENFQYTNKVIELIWEDNRYTDKESLKEDSISKLDEISKPRRNYNVTIIDLAKFSTEYNFLDYFLGDTVTLISSKEKFRDTQRIVKYIEYLNNPTENTCELGNTTLTFEELQAENDAKNEIIDNITNDDKTINGDKVTELPAKNIKDLDIEVGKIVDFTAINADITNLKVQNVTITGELNTVKANIGEANINIGRIDQLVVTQTATINDLKSIKADINDLNATNATLGKVEAQVGNISTLVNGNLTSDNIHSMNVTSDKFTVADGFIKNAMIESLDVSKINSGAISTNKFQIRSDNGGIEIVGATQQFRDKNNKVRIQMGQDTQGNFNFIIRGEDGTSVLIDNTGIKEKAITDDLIKSNMIAQDAIGEKQINYSSFITGFNKDTNTNTIKSTKIMLNNENQTLDVAFNQLKTYSETTKTQLDNLDVGVRNIFLNSSLTDNLDKWSFQSTSPTFTTKDNKKCAKISGALKSSRSIYQGIFGKLEPNTTYTMSGWVYTENIVKGETNFFLSYYIDGYYDNNGTSTWFGCGQKALPLNSNKWVYLTWTFTTDSRISTSTSMLAYLYARDFTGSVYVYNLKLEKGNKATVWMPAVEDVDGAIESVKEVTESHSTTIGVMQGQISTAINNTKIVKDGQTILLKDDYNRTVQTVDSMKVTIGQHTSKIDGLNSTVSTQTSDISQLKNQIKLKVEQTDINTAVNNIQISGRNLTPNSGEFKTTNHWIPNGFGSVSLEDSCIKGTQSIKHEYTDLKAGSTYMVSLVFKTNAESFNANDGNGGHFHILYDGYSDVHFGKKSCVLVYKDPYKVNEFCKYIYKIEVKEGLVNPKLRTMVYHGDGSLAGKTIWLKTLMVEEGNKPTGWVPAIEDVESSISAIDSKITTTSKKVSDIEINVGKITSRVEAVETTTTNVTDLAKAMAGGKILYPDAMFKKGVNGISVYNNSSNGTVAINRIEKISGCPTSSTHCLEVKHTGIASPNFGGFNFATSTKANQILVTRFIAKIPTGRNISWHSNNTGTGGSHKWLTSTSGTGKWEEYICRLKCGDSGSFSSTNYFAIAGGNTPTTSEPLIWHIAYATVIDITDSDESINDLTTRMTSAEQKITDDSITATVKKNFYTKTETDNQITSKGYQTSSQVQQTVNAFELKFQESGGYNLVYNSDFKNGDHLWGISSGAKYYFGTGNWNSPTGLGMAITGQSGTSLYAVQELTNTSYRQAKTFTLSGLVNISSTGTNDSTGAKFQLYVRVTYDDDTKKYHMCNIDESSLNKWQKVFVTFDLDKTKTVTDLRTTVSIQNTTKTLFVSQIMLEVGSMMSPWCPNSSEVYDGVTTIDKEGITVTASNVKSKTNISATGFKITKTDTNEDVFKVNSNGRLLLDGEITAHNGDRKSGYFGLDSIKFYNWWADTNEEIATIYGGKDSSNRRSANMVGRDTVALGIGTSSSGSKVLESTSSKLSIYKDTDFGGGALTNVRKLNYDVTYDTWINRLYIRSNQINTNMASGYMHLNYWKGSGTTSTSTHVKIGNGNNDDANGALTCGNFKATGTKNCIVQTTIGYVGINAYETAECYFGDIGTTILDNEGYSFVYIDNIFTETINTNINYHVFLSVYGDGLARVVKRTPTYFIIKGTANIEVGYEIKAKRKGYEDYRLEREVNNWRIGENHGLDEEYQYERNNFEDSIKQAVQENIKLNTNISQDSLNDLINRTIKDATENKNLIESIEVNLIENTN